ncbi:MAG: FAD-dependent oxidoreductase [Chloroflexi bacterium]|nr:FAD-dependent oxidoreductase [Chloroflexota bacterium]MDK1045559.1 FAD-dependent oxidoreductase [Anaerolineales bacterium]MCH8342147.1 FAD-dependent oxidoreductase [Chloroflexota bacterium]MCH8875788.1 FAD-dependent oxidoreductase [Chloroflexota bacterium]MCI0771835.1 FAD-dependent oxidoreductase [Chloroflexota bacterium]
MRDQARVVIIGGGIIGCSIAYHLAKAGWTDVVLLEKGELTSGSTFHSAGLVSHFRTSPTLMRLMKYSVNLYQQFNLEVGEGLGWYEVGSLRLASSENQLKQLQRQVSTAKALGLEVGIISPAEAMQIFPPMTEQGLVGAVHIPQDGWLEPNGITTEFARRAKESGVAIETDVLVNGIELSPRGEVTQVNTDQGPIKTEIVVNAAGQWAPQIGAMVGVDIPITPIMHQFLMTKPIPGHELPHETPVVRDPDNLIYLREEVGGYLVGGFEPNPKAWSIDGVPWEFTQQLLPPEWELFEVLMEGAIRRVPVLETAEVIKMVNGPEGITPDGHYCLGPVPGLRGFYVAAGMSLNGLAGAGGVGNAIAEWVIEGEPPWDMHEMNIRRFGTHYSDQGFRVERTRELYKYYYYLRFPLDENEWGRPLRTSPLLPRLQELGAVFGEKDGWERVNHFETGDPSRLAGADQRSWGWGWPPYFEQVGEEHQAARERVALLDMTSFGKIDVRGPGALPLLQALTDNNIDKPIGSMTYTQFLNPQGGIESDLTITRWGEEHFRVISGTASLSNDIGWIKLHMNPESERSVQIMDVTAEWACISLWGPYAREVLQSVTEDDVTQETFPFMTARILGVGGAQVWAQRVSYAGELGWELYIKPEGALPLWDELMRAGEAFGIQPIGYKALDSLRLEKGYRLWGIDITPDENPYESGLGFCVRLKSGGDFIGREALLKFREQGDGRRRLSTLTLKGNTCVIYGGEAVYANSQLVGRVRSGGYGYTVGSNICLSYLPLELAEVGTGLEVEVLGQRLAAVVESDTLYDPQGEKLRA